MFVKRDVIQGTYWLGKNNIIWWQAKSTGVPGVIQFPTAISRYFIGVVLDCQYQVLGQITLESICLNFSQCQTFDA
jgi:hypothetical protein